MNLRPLHSKSTRVQHLVEIAEGATAKDIKEVLVKVPDDIPLRNISLCEDGSPKHATFHFVLDTIGD